MNYKVQSDRIQILDKVDFNPEHILECGQVFSFHKEGNVYKVYPSSKYAEIVETEKGYDIITKDVKYFIEYFDLNTDYSKIKKDLSKFEILKEPMAFGSGIRILKQDLFEVLISFIISANNNIKRIKHILNDIRAAIGQKTEYGYAFPTYEQLLAQDEAFFASMGAGYRAKYLFNTLRQITPDMLDEWRKLDTISLQKKLLSLFGVGPKVADCVLLFGYGRGDAFPVDTWIHKVYNRYYPPLDNRTTIHNNLIAQFGSLSGYAQQYLFYYQRSEN